MTAADAEAMAEEYSGHSLRAGHATSAAQNDALSYEHWAAIPELKG
jgi:hypothetical protein